MIIVNAIIAWALWKVADMYFDIGRTALGWACVAASAANFATVMVDVI